MAVPCPITGTPMHQEKIGEVTVDVSPGHGVWLDTGELFLITEDARHADLPFWADLFRREQSPPVDAERRLACPHCGQTMLLETFEGVTLDWCKTHGVWLDAGELEAILNNLRLEPGYLRGVALRLSDMRF